jgi:hypothetical protein
VAQKLAQDLHLMAQEQAELVTHRVHRHRKAIKVEADQILDLAKAEAGAADRHPTAQVLAVHSTQLLKAAMAEMVLPIHIQVHLLFTQEAAAAVHIIFLELVQGAAVMERKFKVEL